MRDAFMAVLTEQAQADPTVNLIIADIGFKVVDPFVAAMPDQFLNVGIAEQTMIGVAAGMAMLGKRPFAYSLGNFPTIRCLEQIRNDLCYHNLDVTVVSVGAGLAYGSLGYTHHTVEDIALMRALPNMHVYSPADAQEVRGLMELMASTAGPKYLRLGKNREPVLHRTVPDLRAGEPVMLRDGSDITLAVTGPIASTVLEAAALLAAQGISARVLSVPVVKPLNAQALADAASGTTCMVTVEEHNAIGGFGSAVLEGFNRLDIDMRVKIMGLPDLATSAIGSQEYLRDQAGLSAADICTQAQASLAR